MTSKTKGARHQIIHIKRAARGELIEGAKPGDRFDFLIGFEKRQFKTFALHRTGARHELALVEMRPQFANHGKTARDVFVALREVNRMEVGRHLLGVAQTWVVPASPEQLQALYHSLNREFFGGVLPLCSIGWSRRLTRTAGNIRVESKQIALSVPLLLDVWNDGARFEVCGVLCTSSDQALREILKHEMIHLWLYVHRLPCGHTREFRLKAKEIGQPKTRHSIARPAPKVGWVYECACCGAKMHRRKRFGRRVACAACCKLNGGGYDERFRLRGRQLQIGGEVPGATR